jgi:transcriptional regulator with XRE-family HTH domain
MPRKNRLKWFRQDRMLSQREVAKLVERDVATVSRHETGDRGLSRDDIKKYAQVYKCESWELFIEPEDVLDTENQQA